MLDAGDRRTWTGPCLLVVALLASGATCSSEAQPGSKSASDAAPAPAAPTTPQPRVGNPSNTGMDTVPDWDALAQDLRTQVHPRMPAAMPTDPKLACVAMLDEARAFYSETEINPEHRRRRQAELDASREADLAGCVAGTSIQAATCVTILLGDRNTEFPWLLDQCSRAYPREPAGRVGRAGSSD